MASSVIVTRQHSRCFWSNSIMKFKTQLVISDARSEDPKKRLEDILSKTQYPSLITIGTNLIEGAEDIHIMRQLPRITMTHSITHSEALIKGLDICYEYGKSIDIEQKEDIKNRANLEDIQKAIDELRQKLKRVRFNRDIIKERYTKLTSVFGHVWGNLEFERVLKLHQQHEHSFLSMIHSSVVWMWTIFEVAVADLWETTLNIGFEVLGKDALERLSKTNTQEAEVKISGKYIKIDYLAQFDFNVKDNVGHILKHRFDFSSIQGIKDAYKFVFPRSKTIERALNNDTLRVLAEQRNLIVHRAGYIDNKYKHAIETEQKIGEKLSVNSQIEYADVVMEVFGDLLSVSNKYLSSKDKATN